MSASLGAASLSELFHRRLYELLQDGKWHDLEPIIADLGRLVPPGIAIRKAERSRRGSTRYNSHGRRGWEEVPPRRKPRSPEELIKIGARRIIYPLFNPTKGETLAYQMRELRSGVRQVRMTRKTRVILGDERRAEALRPAFSALAASFAAQGHDYAAEQVQLTAHEFGFHLSSCPKDCSLLRLTKARRVELELDEGDAPG